MFIYWVWTMTICNFGAISFEWCKDRLQRFLEHIQCDLCPHIYVGVLNCNSRLGKQWVMHPVVDTVFRSSCDECMMSFLIKITWRPASYTCRRKVSRFKLCPTCSKWVCCYWQWFISPMSEAPGSSIMTITYERSVKINLHGCHSIPETACISKGYTCVENFTGKMPATPINRWEMRKWFC